MAEKRALVLGGGGPVGIAWESGLAAGLAEEGLVIAEADYIVGTSAGSFVGAQLASGRSAASLAKAQLAMGAADAAKSGGGKAFARTPDLAPVLAMMAHMPAEGEPSEAPLKEIGAYAAAAQTLDEDAYVASFGWIADPATPYPARYHCTIIDVETGAFRVVGPGDGAPLGRAIAASCSVPGIFPPVTIWGRRWMDGGMRSPTNADVAAGHKRTLVIAVTVGTADFKAGRLGWELSELEGAGGRAEIITPDANSLAAFGPNLMHAADRAAITQAGLAQGRREAARLKAFWTL
ncbi:MAG: patatin-like phospholipase family protein [Hyphomonadaceae bacterium]